LMILARRSAWLYETVHPDNDKLDPPVKVMDLTCAGALPKAWTLSTVTSSAYMSTVHLILEELGIDEIRIVRRGAAAGLNTTYYGENKLRIYKVRMELHLDTLIRMVQLQA